MSMRRIFLGLLLALVTFGAGARLVFKNTDKRIVPHVSSGSYTFSDSDLVRGDNKEISPSPLEATNKFNRELQKAAEYVEFTPCFDISGRRTGERAVVRLLPPHVPKAAWRIMWTQQSEDFSEFFWVESTSLPDARNFEMVKPQEWKKCLPKMSNPL